MHRKVQWCCVRDQSAGDYLIGISDIIQRDFLDLFWKELLLFFYITSRLKGRRFKDINQVLSHVKSNEIASQGKLNHEEN